MSFWEIFLTWNESSKIGWRLVEKWSWRKSRRSLHGFPFPLAIKSSNKFSGMPSLCSDKDRLCRRKVECAKAMQGRGTKGHLRDVIHLQCSGNGMKSLAFDSSSCMSPCSTTYGIGETVLLDQSLQMLEILYFFDVCTMNSIKSLISNN